MCVLIKPSKDLLLSAVLLQGVDLIAAAAPRILALNTDVQLVVVGPVGDLVGARAYQKLRTLAKTFPGRVYAGERVISGAEKCVVLAAADFCLMPSRFEPSGLVDLEFGWNGAVVVGHQTGGFRA
jgi:alpha-1,3-glucan synthase